MREEYWAGQRRNSDSRIDNIFETGSIRLDERLLPYFHFKSTSGEISVISYGIVNGATCVIDDEFARQICNLFNAPLTGSIGIVKRMRAERLLTRKEMQEIRERLRKSKFYMTQELLDQLR